MGMSSLTFFGIVMSLKQLYNSLTHGDPDSAIWNTVQLDGGVVGYSVSKIINNPALCDRICLDAPGWLAAIMGIAAGAFPDAV
jgi:hypothetical protein